MYGTKDQEL